MSVTEDPRLTKDFYDPQKRSSANAVQVHFKDGARTPKIGIDYPAGHPIRRSEVLPVLVEKFESSIRRRFSPERCDRILALCNDPQALDRTEVHRFTDLFAL